MKILYAVLGAGNGHVSRARDIIPHLEKHGDVDIAVSGTDSQVDLPRTAVFHHHGMIFYLGRRGGIDYWKTAQDLRLNTLLHDIATFPIKDYDIIINDFEPITAYAALRAGVRAISVSHQASFWSLKTPRPARRNLLAEQIIRRYAPCVQKIGLHFEPYDSFIRTPIIRSEIRNLEIKQEGHYTVYLPAYADEYLMEILGQIPNTRWEIFSKRIPEEVSYDRFTIKPIANEPYLRSLAGCAGLLTGGGFESPAESMFLGKKVMMVPQRAQYEQVCNAEAGRRLGIPVITIVDRTTLPMIVNWVESPPLSRVLYPDHTEEIVEEILKKQRSPYSVRFKNRNDKFTHSGPFV